VDYLDWRYLGEKNEISPAVFFISSSNGTKVGMSSLICRNYLIRNKKYSIAVSGDSSIDEKYRGLGLSKELFEYVTSFLSEKSISGALALGKIGIFAKIGWMKEEIVSYVYSFDYYNKFYENIKNKILSRFAEIILNYINGIILKLYNTNAYSIVEVTQFDQSFDSLWANVEKSELIIKERSCSALQWRYSRHPQRIFKINKIFKDNNFIGYIIYNIEKQQVVIYDFLFKNNEFIKKAFCLFIKKIWEKESPLSIRIECINENHPYSPFFRQVGFIKRKGFGVFQFYLSEEMKALYGKANWFITYGDKDI
jgi:hypothetical protein